MIKSITNALLFIISSRYRRRIYLASNFYRRVYKILLKQLHKDFGNHKIFSNFQIHESFVKLDINKDYLPFAYASFMNKDDYQKLFCNSFEYSWEYYNINPKDTKTILDSLDCREKDLINANKYTVGKPENPNSHTTMVVGLDMENLMHSSNK